MKIIDGIHYLRHHCYAIKRSKNWDQALQDIHAVDRNLPESSRIYLCTSMTPMHSWQAPDSRLVAGLKTLSLRKREKLESKPKIRDLYAQKNICETEIWASARIAYNR